MKARAALVAGSLAAVVLLTGCSGSVSIGDDSKDTHRIEVRGARTGFVVEVPEEWGITDVWDADTCGSVSYLLREESSLRLVVEAVPTSCPEAADNTQVGNGFHGVYRTVDDVPDPQDPESVDTGLGAATVFTQKHFECANSCNDWNEPVAIITLDAPVDAEYPTLVVRGEKEAVSRADLEEIEASLAAPYVPTG